MRRYRRPRWRDWLVTAVLVAAAVAAVVTCAVLLGPKHPLGFMLTAVAVLLLLVRWHAAETAYQCPECETEFEVSWLEDLLSPQAPTAKYLTCPGCGCRVWARVLVKQDDGPGV